MEITAPAERIGAVMIVDYPGCLPDRPSTANQIHRLRNLAQSMKQNCRLPSIMSSCVRSGDMSESGQADKKDYDL
jgi:hypothetical protein